MTFSEYDSRAEGRSIARREFFRISFADGEACFRDLNGTTTLTTVPEPGTFALLETGLIGLSGAIRRKFQRAAN